jgi:hypothetical protein
MFETPEEMIRLDAEQTVVPLGVAARLYDSLATNPPPPPRPWWRRWFGL